MSPAGHEHGRIVIRITMPLAVYVAANRLGEVYAAETGFKLTSRPDTVLAPDVAFVRKARLGEVRGTKGYWPGPPDLAVEVLSPTDTKRGIEEKVVSWLEFGTSLVWVVSPKRRIVTAYSSRSNVQIFSEGDTLEGGNIIPGFQIRVSDIFAE